MTWSSNKEIHDRCVSSIKSVLNTMEDTPRYILALSIIESDAATLPRDCDIERYVCALAQAALAPELFGEHK